MPDTLVLLHGFAGTRHTWDGVLSCLRCQTYRAVALDLPGHGDARALQAPITFAGCVAEVLAHAPQRFDLCGYSLGGRVALHVALSAPERVARLVLISTGAGIEDPRERAERRAADQALADELERMPFEDFIERWRGQPLFAGDPPAVAALAREDQRRNDPHALAAALRGLSSGEMQPLWDRLGELTMPVEVVVGERDEKYGQIGARIVELLPAGELTVIDGGHALALENPSAVAEVLDRVRPAPRPGLRQRARRSRPR